MSNGTAIIASDIGGIPEIVKKNGILIEKINRLKLQDALQRLISNSEKLKILQKLSWSNFEHSSKNSSKKLDDYRRKILSSYFVNN